MSVIVKGMEMPVDCEKCWMSKYFEIGSNIELMCAMLHRAVPDKEGHRSKKCPLVEIPAPHGRLIDHKKLEKDLAKRWNTNDDQDFCNKEVWHALEEAPTVIDAEA